MNIQSSPIRGVLFDLDNTLHDRDRAFVAWANDFVTVTLGVEDPVKYQETVDMILSLDKGGYGDRNELFRALKDRFPHLSQSPQDLIRQFFATRTPYMRLSDNAHAVFDVLNAKEIPWGIVTNGGREQWDKLRALGLDTATSCIFVSHDFGVGKPEPAIFRAAAVGLDRAPEEILFVGDHAVNDIAGAKDSGMATAWVQRGQVWPAALEQTPPDLIIDDLAELIPLFD